MILNSSLQGTVFIILVSSSRVVEWISNTFHKQQKENENLEKQYIYGVRR